MCNSETARQLRKEWETLATHGNLVTELTDTLRSFVDVKTLTTEHETGYQAIQEKHQVVKDKVAEFVAIRACWRVLKPDESRGYIQKAAVATAAAIGGNLPVKLSLCIASS